VLLFEIIVALLAWQEGGIAVARRGPTPEGVSNIEALGQLLYTRYIFIFEAAGLVLLVAMVGAIVLTEPQARRPAPAERPAADRPPAEDATVNMQPGVGQGVEL
jgi:NADH-quinone oxidoreductase subunit J